MSKILIKSGSVSMEAVLLDTPFKQILLDTLPIEGNANLWGDEIYFSIHVDVTERLEMQETVELGDLGYWQPGKAFCIFFGATPMSGPGEIRPASEVHVFGKIIGDPTQFKKVAGGEKVIIEKIDE